MFSGLPSMLAFLVPTFGALIWGLVKLIEPRGWDSIFWWAWAGGVVSTAMFVCPMVWGCWHPPEWDRRERYLKPELGESNLGRPTGAIVHQGT